MPATTERNTVLLDPRFERELKKTVEPGSARSYEGFISKVKVRGIGHVGEVPDAQALALSGAIFALGQGIGESQAMATAKALIAEMASQARSKK